MVKPYPPYTLPVIDDRNLVDSISEIVDLGNLPIRLGVNTVIKNSAANAVSFIDGALASGTVTITNYLLAHLAYASASAQVLNYDGLYETTASLVSQGVTYTSILPGTIGNSYSVTIIDSASGGLSYSETAGDITIDLGGDTPDVDAIFDLFDNDPSDFVVVTGSGASAVTVHAVESLAGGQNNAILTVAGHALVQGTDWTAGTSGEATASSIASAINLLSEVTASTSGSDTVTVLAAVAGSAGNSIGFTTTDAVNLPVSSTSLIGGNDGAVVTIAGHALVESTDWDSVSSNTTAADNLTDAIKTLS
jgi:hypothetical protein